MAITLIDPHEQPYVRLIEQGISASIEKHKVSGQKVVSQDKRKLFQTKRLESDRAGVEKKEKPLLFGKADKKKVESHSGANQRSRRKPKEGEKAAGQYQAGRKGKKGRS